MKYLLPTKVASWAVILTALFAIVSTLVPRVEFLTILNGIFLGIATAVIIVYSPLGWYSLRKNRTDRASQLALGIGLLWFSIFGQRLYWIVWHYHGSPLSWQSNPFLAFMAFLAIIGGSLFVSAPGYPAPNDDIPVTLWGGNRKLLFSLGAIGGVITFALSIYFE